MANTTATTPLSRLKSYITYECPGLYKSYYESMSDNAEVFNAEVMGLGYINVPLNDSDETYKYFMYEDVRDKLHKMEIEIRNSIDEFMYSTHDSAAKMNYFQMFTTDLDQLVEQSLTIKGDHVQQVFSNFFERIRGFLPKEVKEADVSGNGTSVIRQVKAIHYLLVELKINVDKTKIAEFIRYITGRGDKAKKITNSSIYERLTKDDASEKDLEDLLRVFTELGLSGIMTKISSDIAALKSKRK